MVAIDSIDSGTNNFIHHNTFSAVSPGRIQFFESFKIITDPLLPPGWSVENGDASEHWLNDDSAASFGYEPPETGTWRLLTPYIDTTGISSLNLSFSSAYQYNTSGATIGIATRHGNGSWTEVWSVTPVENIGPVQTLNLDTEDVGHADLQVCWYFSGRSTDCVHWTIDDIILSTTGGVLALDLGSGNVWNTTTEGNYWSDYTDRYPAASHDGTVWDTPYEIMYGSEVTARDYKPLVAPGIEHEPLLAKAGPDQTVGSHTLVTFNGLVSTGPNEIVNWTWTFVDGTPVTLYGPTASHTFDTAGTFEVILKVTDATGNWAVDTIRVTVTTSTAPVFQEQSPFVVSGRNSTTISFVCNVPVNYTLYWGGSAENVTTSAISNMTLDTTHSFVIDGLEANTTYYYKLVILSAGGSRNETEVMSFTTLSGSDTTPDLPETYTIKLGPFKDGDTPLVGATITISLSQDLQGHSAFTAADGIATFTGISAAWKGQSISIRFEQNGYETTNATMTAPIDATPALTGMTISKVSTSANEGASTDDQSYSWLVVVIVIITIVAVIILLVFVVRRKQL